MGKEEVLRILNSNEHFREFHKEFNGKFILMYWVDGVSIYFFNTVGGFVDAWVLMSYDFYRNVNNRILDFIDISKRILQQKINSIDAYKQS